ncbi:MAG: DNA-binding protein WhiA [Bulleidia sp.]|nr:DNA-binding protein WhiA [Bulleidia sp.]
MSFSSDVKNEAAQIELVKNEGRAELSALIQMCSSLSLSNRGMTIKVQVENAAVARTVCRLVKDRYNAEISLSVKRRMNLKKNLIYGIRIMTGAPVILTDLGLYSSRGLLEVPLHKIVSNDSQARAYLCGAFLAGGSINPPEKTNYHLEITANNDKQAELLQELLERFDIHAKTIERRGKQIVYVKAAEKIADFLRIIGANEAVLKFENIRISRDFTNSLTRLNNCDVANEVKTQNAAKNQLEDIHVLQSTYGLDRLDEKLQDVAKLRLQYPEASLNELCAAYEEMTGISVSKSGMKHRFVRLHELAEKRRKI